ncbi:MAG: hypothetical protein KDB61_12775, partial [Planctomycetes bacterium]|nr:hypothetical protein [Planctomycetota bacterium]
MHASLWNRWIQDMRMACVGQSAVARIPVLLVLAYWGLRHMLDPEYTTLFAGINLGIHEAGHEVFRGAGEFLLAAGGTILQCMAPLAAAGVFFRQKDYFAVSFALFWLADNLFSVAQYMGDARALNLPRVSMERTIGWANGDPSGHDWHYMLRELGLLSADRVLAGALRLGACAL